ncbi:MAG: translocated intimin receptor Tir [Terriglobia bacterium]
MKRSTLDAILTDSHFWVPVVVLALGIALLAVLK